MSELWQFLCIYRIIDKDNESFKIDYSITCGDAKGNVVDLFNPKLKVAFNDKMLGQTITETFEPNKMYSNDSLIAKLWHKFNLKSTFELFVIWNNDYCPANDYIIDKKKKEGGYFLLGFEDSERGYRIFPNYLEIGLDKYDFEDYKFEILINCIDGIERTIECETKYESKYFKDHKAWVDGVYNHNFWAEYREWRKANLEDEPEVSFLELIYDQMD